LYWSESHAKKPEKKKTGFVQKSTDFIDSNCIYTTHSYVQYLTELCKKLTNKTAGAKLSFRLQPLNHEYILRYLSGCPVSLSTYMAVLCKQIF